MKTIHILQHVDYEGPGRITAWAESREVSLISHLVPNGIADSVFDGDALMVMGGPMGVNDTTEYPWLKPELEFIRNFMATGKPVLGICLGAQLIAAACGARVYPNSEKELGWGPVTRAPKATSHPLLSHWPETIQVFHWHGDTFDLPADATLLGHSVACPHQGFALGRCLALQFHIELGVEEIRTLIHSHRFPDWEGPFVKTPENFLKDAQSQAPLAHNLLNSLLDHWAGKNE